HPWTSTTGNSALPIIGRRRIDELTKLRILPVRPEPVEGRWQLTDRNGPLSVHGSTSSPRTDLCRGSLIAYQDVGCAFTVLAHRSPTEMETSCQAPAKHPSPADRGS